ncbi:MAG TPA: sigma-54 dependent transcriptional regulator [Chitinophagaceae bacterium]|nr:sigma-54 dependent transcriptional regulator [Chitinophagaceae bacterium]
MKTKLLIVEDEFIAANNLQRILEKAGYDVCSIARSVPIALEIIAAEGPHMVLLDIMLQGNLTGIDLAGTLREKGIPFVYLSANSNRQILDAAKATRPYGFLVKPFREKDVLVMLDVAWYLHQQKQQAEDNPQPGTVTITSPNWLPAGGLKPIIGESQLLTSVLDSINIVSQTSTSVLILGESGTGKELVAKAIHRMSDRKDKPLIVVNCAALPLNLVESELFGHEKGAFTNAIQKKTGKFEMADGATIFLDEIGELPLELQVKFLRVLQEQEIEPVGGQLKKVDVRVIAATNRHLEEEIAKGRFRIDLYYRLNVFPIELPPLRERQDDVLLLANHFLRLYSIREGKNISGFSAQVNKLLTGYSWPGNVRELENIIERSVLLATGPIIDSLLLPQNKTLQQDNSGKIKTMEENERDHVIAVLKKCDWKLHGPGGAAEMLNINEFTLRSRMKKLGIRKDPSA